MGILPKSDQEYLTAKNVTFEELIVGDQKGIVFKYIPLLPGKYDATSVDVLVLLPPGYPDIGPDMFYTLPWIKLIPANQYPKAANQPVAFSGKNWQRWSRHSNEWRPGKDGMSTILKRIEHALEIAQA